jgi:hypothetical protein
MATAGIFGSHLAGDFFLGVDILVISRPESGSDSNFHSS